MKSSLMLLVFTWLAVCPQPISARLQNATLPETAPGEVYTVCTAGNVPYSNCTIGLYPTDASGYEVEVFKRVAISVGLRPDQYNFFCMQYADLVNDMVDPNGICDITAAAYTFSALRLATGAKFVYPESYRTGLTVMVHATIKRGGQWLFLRPFRWEVWVFLLCAAVAAGLSVQLVEWISKRHLPKEERHQLRFRGEGGCADSLWATIAQVASAGEPLTAASLPSRLIIFVWCFLILLLLTLYTGNAAAILTTTSINTNIQSASDLIGGNWGAYTGSVPVLASQGLVPTRVFPLNNDADRAVAVAALLNDEVEALVFECALVSYLTSYICDLQQIGECFALSDQGQTMWQNASDVSVARLGAAVLALEDAGDLDRLRNSFITPGSACSSQLNSGSTSVTFMQVSGLWIMLAGAIGIAVLWAMLLHHINKRKYVATLRRRMAFTSRMRTALPELYNSAARGAGPAVSTEIVDPSYLEKDTKINVDIEKVDEK